MGVFVSYSSRDKEAVTRLTQDLQDADEQVWLDQRLAGGEAWWRAILEQIRGCDVFIFALSQNSIQSKPCQAELRYAQDLGLPILPVQVGPVDSMQLNPLATVQTVDYRTSTSTVGMRLLAALHRALAQRQPLPSPLPAAPPVPFEYLMRLYTTISGTDQLSPRDQAALVAQLQVGLREDGDNDTARGEIVVLLNKLRDREDVTYRTRTDVDAILVTVDTPARPGSQPAPETTQAIPRRLSPRWPRMFHARPVGLRGTATTDTTEPRVDTPPPSTTPAQKVTVPRQKSQRQTETTRGREKLQISVRRSTAILVAMAVTAVILTVIAVPLEVLGNNQSHGEGHPFFWGGLFITIAVALTIAIVVLLVRRRSASETTRGREKLQISVGRSTAILFGMAVTAAGPLPLAVGIGLIIASYPGEKPAKIVAATECIVIGAIIVASLVAVLIVRAIRR
jgi:hypothetical protein